MARRPSALLLAALALLAACRSRTWRTEGDVISVDGAGAVVAHEAIPGVMDAMTMRFAARPPSLLRHLRPGMRVRIDVAREGAAWLMVGVEPVAPGASGPSVHDHTPHHGGVVRETEGVHVEIAGTRDGRVRVWLSDPWRRPLPPADASGTLRLALPGGARTLDLVPAGDALEARGAPFAADAALADVEVAVGGKRVAVQVLVDLTGERAGVPIPPETGCEPIDARPDVRAPRCAVRFASTFTASGATPDGGRALVATSHGATSVWRLPAATLAMGLEPLPPVAVLPAAHEPDPRVVAVRPDGAEILVAAGARLAFYDAATGRLRRTLDGPGGAIDAVAWAPDGTRLLVAAAGAARLVAAADGQVVRTLAVDGRALAVALDAGGRLAAVGTDVGTIALADPATGAVGRALRPSLQPVAAVAFAGGRLLVAGDDGALRVVEPDTGRESARADAGAALRLLAVAPDGRHAATAGADHVVRVHRLPDASVVERLEWHRATVSALVFGAGPTVVSGDNDAVLAVWDVPAAR